MRRAATIDQLGAGRYDTEPAVLTYGDQEAYLNWDDADARWVGQPNKMITMRGDQIIGQTGPLAYPNWAYLSSPYNEGLQLGGSSYTWMPCSIRDPDAGYDAGMTIEEHMTAVLWNWDSGALIKLATVLYPMDTGDVISTEISSSAGDFVGIIMDSSDGVREFKTVGWSASAIDVPTKPILAPHLYMAWVAPKDTRPALEYVEARWRWVGEP